MNYLALLFVLALVVLAVVAVRSSRAAGELTVADAAIMPRGPRLVLVTYLVLVGSLLLYLIAKLYSVDFPESPYVIEVPPQRPIATKDSSARNAPVLLEIFPQSTLGTAPSFELALYGRNFDTTGATVRFNRQIRGKKEVSPNLIRVVADPADLVGIGTLLVDVQNPDGKVSNALPIQVVRPRMEVALFSSVFPMTLRITREVQLILLVLCAGALGSYIHAVKSLADFIGNQTLTSSWFWWYITRPFLGMALAFVFYAVLRGGFLTGTPADVRVVNPFGAIAVAALAGMFADRASQKLAEIFDALFKGDDPRSGKLAAPVIQKLDPATLIVGAAPPVLRLIGDRLGKTTVVRVGGQDRPIKTSAEKEVTIELQPADLAKAGDLPVVAVAADGTVSPPATLRVGNP